MVGVVEDDVSSKCVRDYPFEVLQFDVSVDRDEPGRGFERDDFPVIGIRETDAVALSVRAFGRSRDSGAAFKPLSESLKTVGEWMFADSDANIEIWPAKIEIRVEFVEP